MDLRNPPSKIPLTTPAAFMFRGHAYNFGLRILPLEPGSVDKSKVFSFRGPRFEFTSQLHRGAHNLCDVPGILTPPVGLHGYCTAWYTRRYAGKGPKIQNITKKMIFQKLSSYFIFSLFSLNFIMSSLSCYETRETQCSFHYSQSKRMVIYFFLVDV